MPWMVELKPTLQETILSVLAVHCTACQTHPALGQEGIDFPGQAGLDIAPF